MTDTQTPALEQREVVVTQVLEAEPETVWQAWVTPERFAYWFGAELEVQDVALDVRDDGEWRATMVAPDGTLMPFAGVYRDVEEHEQLVMVFQDAPGASGDPADWQVLTMTLTDEGDATEIELVHAGRMDPENLAALEDGYQSFLDHMAQLLADD